MCGSRDKPGFKTMRRLSAMVLMRVLRVWAEALSSMYWDTRCMGKEGGGAGMRAPFVSSFINFLVGRVHPKDLKFSTRRHKALMICMDIVDLQGPCSSKRLVQEANDEGPF